MKTLFALVVAIAVCLSVVDGQTNAINSFYPSTMTETTCSNTQSWTMWFNTGSPTSAVGDNENATIILTQYAKYMCLNPSGIQAQSVNYPTGSIGYGWRYTSVTPIVQMVSFYVST